LHPVFSSRQLSVERNEKLLRQEDDAALMNYSMLKTIENRSSGATSGAKDITRV